MPDAGDKPIGHISLSMFRGRGVSAASKFLTSMGAMSFLKDITLRGKNAFVMFVISGCKQLEHVVFLSCL